MSWHCGIKPLTLDPANNLGIAKITYLEPWSRATIQENILQLQISMAYLLAFENFALRINHGK